MGNLLEQYSLSRRKFLQVSFLAGASILTGACVAPRKEPGESLHQVTPRVLAIDTVPYGLFPTHQSDFGVTIASDSTEGERGAEVLGEEYIPLEEMLEGYMLLSVLRPNALQVFLDKRDENSERALLAASQVQYDNHGLIIAHSMEGVYNQYGLTRNIQLHALQDMLDVDFPRDEFGNQGITFISRMDKAADIINRYPDRPLVNMSWLPGSNTLWYREYDKNGAVESPKFVFEGGFTGEHTQENLREIGELRRACPRHFIVSAASNMEGDFSREMQELAVQGDMPSNGVIVGDYEVIGHSHRPLENELGPDIYVRSQAIKGTRRGSSSSCAMFTAMVDSYIEMGNSLQESVEAIFKYNARPTAWNSRVLWVVDPSVVVDINHIATAPVPTLFTRK